MKYSYSLVRGLSSTQIAIIVAIVVIVIVIGAIAGIMLTRKPTPTVITTTVTTTTSTTIPPTKIPVVFYNWLGSVNKDAFNSFIPYFEKLYPNYIFESQLVPGAGGTNAKYAILALIEAGKPPTTFQTHYGPEMISYVEVAPNGSYSFVNMTPIAEKMGLFKYVVPEVLEAGAYNGTLFSLPIDAGEGALLYINIKLLKQYDLPIPTNLTMLTYDTVQLAKHGVHPWIIPGGDAGWDQLNLWENIFLALGGPRLYNEFTYGVLPLNNVTVQKIINETNELFLNYSSYNYPGWQSYLWTQGIALLIQGDVAFQTNGDWVTDYAYDFLNTTIYPATEPYISWPNVTVVVEPFPGTQNDFALVVDSIAVPRSPYQNAGLTLAETWASYMGQELWTKWKMIGYYINDTNFYVTPAQWYNYERLLNISRSAPQNFVYQISDGGVFDNVFAELDSGILTLAEVGSPALSEWNSTLYSAMHEEEQQWLEAAKLGLGYMGFPGHPFANYYPPWVTDPAAYGLKQTTKDYGNNSNVLLPAISIIVGFIIITDILIKKYYNQNILKLLKNILLYKR
jgi:glucose/arabinose transport system substrate-binding protein